MYATYTLYFLLLFFRSSSAATTTPVDEPDDDDCLININRDLSRSNPLLLSTGNPPQFLYPDPMEPSTVRLDDNQHFRIVCGGTSLYVSCRDTKFYIDSSGYRFRMRDVDCRRRSSRDMLKPMKAGCPSNVLCYQVGFQLNLFDFLPTIDLIYVNEARLRPLWAHTTILSIIGHRQKRGEDDDYEEGELFSGSISAEMTEIFNRDYQRTRFAKILGSQELAEKYITEKPSSIFQLLSSVLNVKEGLAGGEHLVRGQLIDNDDFFYKPQQDTVLYYANVAPMWRSIASGNWHLAGEMIRKAASDTRSNIELWAGTMRTLELEDSKGAKRQIYMAYNTTTKTEVVPVPKLLFKYAYDREHNRGVVIIVVNDPFIKKTRPEHIICPEQELCRRLQPSFGVFELGYTYCCTLADFAKNGEDERLACFSKRAIAFLNLYN